MLPTGSAKAEEIFKPGEHVPASGVYVVIHAEHREEHAVTLLEGETFPPCSVCIDQVRFRLDRPATTAADARK